MIEPSNIAAKFPIMAITHNNSINVNPAAVRRSFRFTIAWTVWEAGAHAREVRNRKSEVRLPTSGHGLSRAYASR